MLRGEGGRRCVILRSSRIHTYTRTIHTSSIRDEHMIISINQFASPCVCVCVCLLISIQFCFFPKIHQAYVYIYISYIYEVYISSYKWFILLFKIPIAWTWLSILLLLGMLHRYIYGMLQHWWWRLFFFLREKFNKFDRFLVSLYILVFVSYSIFCCFVLPFVAFSYFWFLCQNRCELVRLFHSLAWSPLYSYSFYFTFWAWSAFGRSLFYIYPSIYILLLLLLLLILLCGLASKLKYHRFVHMNNQLYLIVYVYDAIIIIFFICMHIIIIIIIYSWIFDDIFFHLFHDALLKLFDSLSLNFFFFFSVH